MRRCEQQAEKVAAKRRRNANVVAEMVAGRVFMRVVGVVGDAREAPPAAARARRRPSTPGSAVAAGSAAAGVRCPRVKCRDKAYRRARRGIGERVTRRWAKQV